MFARPNASHSQVAYVTNDLEAATALLQEQYGAPGFFTFTNTEPGMEQIGQMQLKIGLARVGGVEIEVIEPIGDTAPLFSDVLKAGAGAEGRAGDSDGNGLVIRFHHICSRVDGPIENWEAYSASIDTVAHPIVYGGQMGEDMRFFYTDERANVGHYVEHIWLSPRMLERMMAATPTFPSPQP